MQLVCSVTKLGLGSNCHRVDPTTTSTDRSAMDKAMHNSLITKIPTSQPHYHYNVECLPSALPLHQHEGTSNLHPMVLYRDNVWILDSESTMSMGNSPAMIHPAQPQQASQHSTPGRPLCRCEEHLGINPPRVSPLGTKQVHHCHHQTAS